VKIPCFVFLGIVALAQSQVQVGKGIFRGQVIEYSIENGRAMYQGDIDLGPAEDLDASDISSDRTKIREGDTTANASFRWPNGVVPYVLDADVPNPQRVMDAITNWNSSAPVKIQPRASEVNYVHIVRFPSNGRCSSSVGMVGGEQLLRLDDSCASNGITHELGHALGLWHEQSRADRNFYVTVDLSHTDKRYLGDHSLQLANGVVSGGYDYGSIMHYTRYEESRYAQALVYETIPPGMPIDGSGHGLSAGDIDAVTRLYGGAPAQTTVTSNPPGLQVLVDGVSVTTPMAFNWPSGSVHNLDVPNDQMGGANTRYQFGRWNDNGAQSHAITVTSDLTVISASFIRQYKVQIGVSPANGGSSTLTPSSPDGFYTEGTQVTVTATAAAGFTFSGWNGTGSNFYVLIDAFANPVASFRVEAPTLAYVAHFTQSPLVTFATDPPNIPITVNGTRGNGPRTVVVASPGASIPVIADPTIVLGIGSDQWVFDGWSDGGAATHNVTLGNPPYPTITARFHMQHLVTAATSGVGTVTVTPSSSSGYYDEGTVLTITANPGTGYQFTGWSRDLSGASPTQTLTVTDQTYVLATFQRPFALTSAGIVNAASYLGGGVSPGEIVTIFGWQIGASRLTTLAIDSNGHVASTLAGSQVLFDNVAAPLVYTSPNQIAAVVPYGVAARLSTSVQVSLNGTKSAALSVPVLQAAPSLFTYDASGQGLAAIVNQDGTVNSPTNPALKGSVVVLYGTGEGITNPAVADGTVIGTPLPSPALQPVTVLLGGPKGVGIPAQVLYAGSAPSDVAGVLQVNMVIPPNVPSGNVPVTVSVGGFKSLEMTSVAIAP
jgi:uncharacterized protein (TIGR03437 family)